MLLDKLEGLDEAKGLLDGATNGQVVDGDLSEDALGIDDEETAEGDALVLEEDSIVTRDLVRLVGEQGQVEIGSEAALLAREVRPGEVRAEGASDVRLRREYEIKKLKKLTTRSRWRHRGRRC